MPLHPGTSLGPYRVDAPLGAGGMGEVLPEHVAADPDLKQRFETRSRNIQASRISSMIGPDFHSEAQ